MSEIKDTVVRLKKTDDAAAYLGISRRKLQELVQDREIGSIKFGRSIRFDPADLEDFIDRNKVKPRGWKGTKSARNKNQG